jgi:hypothetical protein
MFYEIDPTNQNNNYVIPFLQLFVLHLVLVPRLLVKNHFEEFLLCPPPLANQLGVRVLTYILSFLLTS